LVSVPMPLIVPPKLRLSLRLKVSPPLSTTLPTMLPAVPPLPMISEPAAIVVPPL